MKKYLLFAFIAFALLGKAQNVLTPALQHEINNHSSETLDVLVYLNDRFDPIEFHSRMNEQKANKDMRVKQIQKELKQIARNSQYEFKDEVLKLAERGYSDIVLEESFWIINAVRLSVSVSDIDEIAAIPTVKRIDINSPRYTFEQPVKEMVAEARSEGGIEPGLEAINAPALWAMGYTGRNLLFLSVDTGVFPTHPAISNRFLGNNRPLNQVWYGIRAPVPFDHANSSHGTHTTGTVLGLVEETNDTIGVAYSAYWIATDPVASVESDILDPVEFMQVFEWVLNPDGNDQTTDDVPDVINNSWGYDYTLALQFDACNLEEAQVLEVIEAAGILSPFSAGNEGPNSQTTGFPAMLAYSELNVMSVGALNGNNSSFPIASFSSRGPTPCIETEGALQIKPEVSAPGVNVRSCSGQNGFSQLSGTSMACPHVSGALLLLKEAFPYLDAVTLKQSLYETAIDLGEPGEDNVYGRGMIDVLAAYNYLALSNDPVPPVTDSFNLAIEIRQFGNEFNCPDNASINPQFAIMNKGSENLTQVSYSWVVNDGDTLSAEWTGDLAAGEEELIVLDEVNLMSGKNKIYVWGSSTDITRDFDIYNNSDVAELYVVETGEFPYIEDCESFESEFIDVNWYVSNPDGGYGWKLANAPSVSDENKAFFIDLYHYYPQDAQKDEIFSSIVSLPDTDEQLNLSFDLAYRKRLEYLYNDSLYVSVSTDCGSTFSDILFADGGETMATMDQSTYSVFYVPESTEDWDTINLNVSQYKGQDIMVKFTSVNDRGNNMYLDNIRFYTGNADYVALKKRTDVSIYPNPTESVIYVKHELTGTVNYEILNLNAQTVMANKLINNARIDVSSLSKGLYMIKIFNNNEIAIKQLVVQ